jgi:hypothetical protein
MKSIHLSDSELTTLGRVVEAYAAGDDEAPVVRSIAAKLAEATDDDITEATRLIG